MGRVWYMKFKIERNNPRFKPQFDILLQSQSIVNARL